MQKIVVLWSTPRTTSTAFEWMMRMRGDMACFHEPFGEAWYKGDDARFPRLTPDSPRVPGLTLEVVLNQLLRAAETRPVFSKDMPHYIVPFGRRRLSGKVHPQLPDPRPGQVDSLDLQARAGMEAGGVRFQRASLAVRPGRPVSRAGAAGHRLRRPLGGSPRGGEGLVRRRRDSLSARGPQLGARRAPPRSTGTTTAPGTTPCAIPTASSRSRGLTAPWTRRRRKRRRSMSWPCPTTSTCTGTG